MLDGGELWVFMSWVRGQGWLGRGFGAWEGVWGFGALGGGKGSGSV